MINLESLGKVFLILTLLVLVEGCYTLILSLLITKYSAITLLDELDKDRNQLDCFSFSVEAGDWEAESSILVFLEAGGSEGT